MVFTAHAAPAVNDYLHSNSLRHKTNRHLRKVNAIGAGRRLRPGIGRRTKRPALNEAIHNAGILGISAGWRQFRRLSRYNSRRPAIPAGNEFCCASAPLVPNREPVLEHDWRVCPQLRGTKTRFGHLPTWSRTRNPRAWTRFLSLEESETCYREKAEAFCFNLRQ